MTKTFDVAVIGCGPAGMSAASEAQRHGLTTVLIDEQVRPGGQIYRNVGASSLAMKKILGSDYVYGQRIVDEFISSGTVHLKGASVWDIDKASVIQYLKNGRSESVSARSIILATGAMERPSPMPGWTLPGVMNAGAVQIMMKTSAIAPTGPVVLVGCGPLILLVANQLLDAGTEIAGIIDTSRKAKILSLTKFVPGVLRSWGDLYKGLSLLWRLRQSSIPTWRADGVVAISGDETSKRVSFKSDGMDRKVEGKTILLHHGVIPSTQITRMLGLEHVWNSDQMAWQARLGRFGQSSHDKVFVAGDGGGIAGARAAESSGKLAAIGAALKLGALHENDASNLATLIEVELQKHLGIRPLLDFLYAPPEWIQLPGDEVVVCRCEEVTAGRIREMASLACAGPNQTKFFSRCGMGPCQGRMCGTTVSRILADANGKSIEETGYYRIRSPLKPIPLAAFASGPEISLREFRQDGK